MGLVPSGTIVLKMLQSCEKLVTGRASQTGPRHIFHQCGIKLTGTDTVSLYISTYDLCMLETSFCLYAALLLVELMLAIASRLNSAPAEMMLWPCLGHPLSCRGWPEQVAQRSDKSRVPEVSAERKTGLTPCFVHIPPPSSRGAPRALQGGALPRGRREACGLTPVRTPAAGGKGRLNFPHSIAFSGNVLSPSRWS
jgi:hypothetical protein